MNSTVNVNGKITDGATAVVSVFDHGFLYGEGVYETLRTYHRHPFLLDRHLRRFRESAALINLHSLPNDDQITTWISQTMQHAALECEQYVRLVVTRGVGDLSYDPVTCTQPTTVIIVKPHVENSQDVLSKGIAVIVSSVLRNHPKAINPQIKSNNLLNNALAMQEALRAGAQEALMRNYRGEISECAQSNVFLVRRGKVVTPPIESGLLEGVTRTFLFEVANQAKIKVCETVLRDEDFMKADEVFITSTTREIIPVTRLDGRPVGSGAPGPVTETLAEAFHQRVWKLSNRQTF